MGSKRKAQVFRKVAAPVDAGSGCSGDVRTEKMHHTRGKDKDEIFGISELIKNLLATQEKVQAAKHDLAEAEEDALERKRQVIEVVTQMAMRSDEVAIEIVRILNERLPNPALGSSTNLELSKLLNIEQDVCLAETLLPELFDPAALQEAGAVQEWPDCGSPCTMPADWDRDQRTTFMVGDVPAHWSRADLCKELQRWNLELGRDVDCVCLIGSGGAKGRSGHKHFGFVNTCSAAARETFTRALLREFPCDPLRVEIAKNHGLKYYHTRHPDDSTFALANAAVELPGKPSKPTQVSSDQGSTTADTDLLRHLMDAPVTKHLTGDQCAADEQADEERVEHLEKLVEGSCNKDADDLLLRTLQVPPSQDEGKT